MSNHASLSSPLNAGQSREDLARRIGARVREIRAEQRWSQKKLANASSLSTPLISRIENGLIMPSIPALQAIATSLGVDIGLFFRAEEEKGFVISRQGTRRTKDSKKGYEIEFVAEGLENAFMEPAIVTERGKEQDPHVELAVHDGQEFMYVLEGKLEVTLGKEKILLAKGDAAYWFGFIPHKGVSLGKKPARTLNVHLIPGKRVGTF